jgi:hypothetical protein
MPKNIVLLSDGTGNSAAKLFKTNVWRIYDALDLRYPFQQVAYYDDGVGTSTFRPLALLGGAIGFGLKRNVLRLYRFLCEQYEPGDLIYAFGFSRGAFTIRVLMALVANQGIIRVRADKFPAVPAAPTGLEVLSSLPPAVVAAAARAGVAVVEGVEPVRTTMTASELRRLAKRAYRRYRYRFNQTTWLVRWAVVGARVLRDASFNAYDRMRGRPVYDPTSNHHFDAKENDLQETKITFIGLWDTVDAYGLPVDELTEGVNRWLWPLTLPNCTLSDKVRKACHALSLDDERHTFHPVLWDESTEPRNKVSTSTDEERVSQVWFAGAHANVGGGYPNDALSAVSLRWMAIEAQKRGIVFLPSRLADWTDRRDPLGTIYDSRRGLAASYRYNPRRIEHLTNGQKHERAFFGGRWPKADHKIEIARPKIHESVFTRIDAGSDFYAPIGLPEHYAVVDDDGTIVDGRWHPYETAIPPAERVRAQEVCWNLVWWRRVAYFAATAASLALVAWPRREGAEAVAAIAANGGGLRLIEGIGSLLPAFASPWVQYYAAAPLELAAGLVVLALFIWTGRTLQSGIRDRMDTIWRYATTSGPHPDLRLPGPGVLFWLTWLRRQSFYHATFAVVRRILMPHAFGLLLIVWIIGGVNRIAFEAFNIFGAPCAESDALTAVGQSAVERSFQTASFCAATGLRLTSGARYELTARFEGAWDGGVGVPDARGFGLFSPGLTAQQRAIFFVALPFKRLVTANWFTMVARVDDAGAEHVAVTAEPTRFTARKTGELFLFVNDALVPAAILPDAGAWPRWDRLYSNNQGTARITIKRIG